MARQVQRGSGLAEELVNLGIDDIWTVRHSVSATHDTSNVRVAVRPPGAGSFAVEGVSTGVADSGDLLPSM